MTKSRLGAKKEESSLCENQKDKLLAGCNYLLCYGALCLLNECLCEWVDV